MSENENVKEESMNETPKTIQEPDISKLYAAFAKAQGQFPTIPKDKRVKVTSTRTGSSYFFNYASLDSIFAAVRKPLADNGLAVVQDIRGGCVVTLILHESGAKMVLAPVPIKPAEEGPQAMGSALTYAKRYSAQLGLGVVAEDDDDANIAEGNKMEPRTEPTGSKNEKGKPAVTPPTAKKTASTATTGDKKEEPSVPHTSPATEYRDEKGTYTPIKENQKRFLYQCLRKHNASEAEFCKLYGIKSVAHLRPELINEAIKAVETLKDTALAPSVKEEAA